MDNIFFVLGFRMEEEEGKKKHLEGDFDGIQRKLDNCCSRYNSLTLFFRAEFLKGLPDVIKNYVVKGRNRMFCEECKKPQSRARST